MGIGRGMGDQIRVSSEVSRETRREIKRILD